MACLTNVVSCVKVSVFTLRNYRTFKDVDSVELFDDFRALKSSFFDDFRALKSSIF